MLSYLLSLRLLNIDNSTPAVIKCSLFAIVYSMLLIVNTVAVYDGNINFCYEIEPLDLHPANFMRATLNIYLNQFIFILAVVAIIVILTDENQGHDDFAGAGGSGCCGCNISDVEFVQLSARVDEKPEYYM